MNGKRSNVLLLFKLTNYPLVLCASKESINNNNNNNNTKI